MELQEIRKKVVEALEECGIYIEDNGEDFDVREYFEDSIHFISSIVQIENAFHIELPENALYFDDLDSFDKLCMMIQSTVEESESC